MLMPFGGFISADGGVFMLYTHGLMKNINTGNISVYENYALDILAALVIIFLIYAIFIFKNRTFQIKLCNLIIFLLVVIAGTEIWQFIRTLSNFPIHHIKIAFFFPFISIIFTLLARKFIRKDEELVRSTNRIR
jgi:hypothetical protein